MLQYVSYLLRVGTQLSNTISTLTQTLLIALHFCIKGCNQVAIDRLLLARRADLGRIYVIFGIWILHHFHITSLSYKHHCLKIDILTYSDYFGYHFHAHLYSSFNHQFHRSCTALNCLSQDNQLVLIMTFY